MRCNESRGHEVHPGSFLSPCEFMEQIFIECLVLVFGPRGEEDVASDELVDHLTVTAHTGEGCCHVLVKLYGHLK